MSLEETLTPYIDGHWHYSLTIGVSPGWEQIVLTAHERLVAIDPDYTINQIKEKFGGLRYYAHTASKDPKVRNRFTEILAEVETDSYRVCEQCATRENVKTGVLGEKFFWILTLCDSCRATRLADRLARSAKYDALISGEDDGT